MDWHGMNPVVTFNVPDKWPWEETVGDKPKIKVPDGMLKVTHDACLAEIQRLNPEQLIGYATMDAICISEKVTEAALRCLSENPIVPTDEQIQEWFINTSGEPVVGWYIESFKKHFVEAQRRMFLEPEPIPNCEQFMECDTCRAKPGSPPLCVGCLHNRAAINRMRNNVKCCERDNDGDGNCDVHSAPGVLRNEAFKTPSAYERATKAIGAVTLTREEGEQIIEYVRGAIHDIKRTFDPTFPEEVRGLLISTLGAPRGESYSVPVDLDVVNDRIIEAFRRGQQSAEPSYLHLYMYIVRHFEDAFRDNMSLKNRAQAAVDDYEQHLKRNR